MTQKRRKSKAKSSSLSSLLPIWNKPLLEPTAPGSRDPLGFQRYAAIFSDQLLPNITVLTGRARYFSYLAWVLDELQRYAEPYQLAGEGLPFEQYNEFLGRYERFLALAEAAWHLHHPVADCHWVGERRSKSMAGQGRATLRMDVSLTVQQGSQGALADYRQSMQKLGLLSEHPTLLADTLTDAGQELARYFRKAGQTAKTNRMSDLCLQSNLNSIKIAQLKDAGKYFCLSQLSPEERKLLNPLLLGGGHESAVRELTPLLKGHSSANETRILDHYLTLRAKNGTALLLKRISAYQIFAFACLSIFQFVYRSFSEAGESKRLEGVIHDQLKAEKLQPGSTIESLARRIEWQDERSILLDDPSTPHIRASIRLLYWISRMSLDGPEVIYDGTVDSVSLPQISRLITQPGRKLSDFLFELCDVLISDHQRVFLSKRKRPWLNLFQGTMAECLDHTADPPLIYPPNSVRLSSLITLYRDLQKHHA